MTAQEFEAAYRPTADAVSSSTGIDPVALLAQWACETAWSTQWAGRPYNLGNIRNGPGGAIISYGSLEIFIAACISTWHNGYYAGVLAATDTTTQLEAICASPWSAGHYGGSLDAYAQPLEEFELTPEQAAQLASVLDLNQKMYNLLTVGGIDSATLDSYAASVILPAIKAQAVGVGSVPPPEPAEPSKITLDIQSIPGIATGSIS